MWPHGVYGVPGAPTFVDEPEGGWVVLIDPPWTPQGLEVGRFPGLAAALAFVYGPPAAQQPLPLEWP